jgi:hypothetical protein
MVAKSNTELLNKFRSSVYYKGVLHMLRMIHREESRFSNWGFVLYTNADTKNLLQDVFPFSQFPKLCLVVVDWPFYALSNGSVDTSILRCLRFQSMELFPMQLCLIRDADTLFQRVLNETSSSDENVTNAIETWEAHFLERWLGLRPSPPLVIGTSIMYKKEWHVNTPLAIALPTNRIAYGRLLEQSKVVFGADYENPIFGVFAGFVNVAADKSSLDGLWQRCVEYLQTRFFMTRFSYKYKYKRYISNTFSIKYYGATVGKDEKCILFAMCRYYLPSIYFYDIHYSAETGLGQTMEYFTYLVEKTKNIIFANKPKKRGYTNENTVVRYLVRQLIPAIEVTKRTVKNTNGTTAEIPVKSHLLNPESIDFVFDSAKAVSYTTDFMHGTNISKTEEVLSLHELYHRKMEAAMAVYETWLTTTPHAELLATVKQQLKEFVSSQQAQGVPFNFDTTAEDLFLQNAGIYSASEELEFAEKYKADKAAKNAAATAGATAPSPPALGGVPGAEVEPKGGSRHKTRKTSTKLRRTRGREGRK